MPQHRSNPRKEGDEALHILRLRLPVKTQEKDRKDRLRDIHEQYRRPGPLPECAEDIGAAGISGARMVDVDAVELRVEIAARKISEEISDEETDQHSHRAHSFSPLSRMIKRSGVPRKPKASRIRFSRYLV